MTFSFVSGLPSIDLILVGVFIVNNDHYGSVLLPGEKIFKSYVGDSISYVGDNKSYVGDSKSYVGVTNSYVGDNKSYVGDNKSYVGVSIISLT